MAGSSARASVLAEDTRTVNVLAEARTVVDHLKSARPYNAKDRANGAGVVERLMDEVRPYWQGIPCTRVAIIACDKLGLAHVPTVVRALRDGAGLSIDVSHRALFKLADAGEIELRPSGGTEFDTAADLALAPPGPNDTRLVYARRLR
jgi:predicted polyphosphate/ATP-dependent NAD kinase